MLCIFFRHVCFADALGLLCTSLSVPFCFSVVISKTNESVVCSHTVILQSRIFQCQGRPHGFGMSIVVLRTLPKRYGQDRYKWRWWYMWV